MFHILTETVKHICSNELREHNTKGFNSKKKSNNQINLLFICNKIFCSFFFFRVTLFAKGAFFGNLFQDVYETFLKSSLGHQNGWFSTFFDYSVFILDVYQLELTILVCGGGFEVFRIGARFSSDHKWIKWGFCNFHRNINVPSEDKTFVRYFS